MQKNLFLILQLFAFLELVGMVKKRQAKNVETTLSTTNESHKKHKRNADDDRLKQTISKSGLTALSKLPIHVQNTILAYAQELSLVSTLPIGRSVALSHDATLLASAQNQTGKLIEVWKLPGNIIGSYDFPTQNDDDDLLQAIFSPDGKYLAASTDNGRIGLWNVSTNTFLGEEIFPEVDEIRFLQNGNFLLSSNYADNEQRIYRIPSLERISFGCTVWAEKYFTTQKGSEEEIRTIGNNKLMYTVSMISNYKAHALSSDDFYLALTYNGGIDIYKNQNMELLKNFENFKQLLPGCQHLLLDLQKLIVSYLGYEKIAAYNNPPTALVEQDKSCFADIIRFSPDSKYIAFVFHKGPFDQGHGRLFLMNRKTGNIRFSLDFDDALSDFWFSPQGNYIIGLGDNCDYDSGSVYNDYIISSQTGKLIKKVSRNSHAGNQPRLSNYVMVTDNDKETEIFSLSPTELQVALNKTRRMKYLKLLLKSRVKQIAQKNSTRCRKLT